MEKVIDSIDYYFDTEGQDFDRFIISGIGNNIIVNSRIKEMHITGIDNSIKFGK